MGADRRRAKKSCAKPIWSVAGKSVTGGRSRHTGRPHPQRALLDEQAGQCGYCLSGIIISARLLDRPAPTRAELRALDDNICLRLHNHILRAVERPPRGRERPEGATP
jgi:nicotinate dehydrogenase subunit A